MRDEATKLFEPKGFSSSRAEAKGFSRAEDEDAHREAEAMDKVLAVAHRSTWGGVSLISPHPKEGHSHLLHREAGFPKDVEVNKVSQQGPQHSCHKHLLPKAKQTEDSKVHRSIAAQPASRERIKSTKKLFGM